METINYRGVEIEIEQDELEEMKKKRQETLKQLIKSKVPIAYRSQHLLTLPQTSN